MNSMKNKVQLIGNLGNDPEVKTIGNGKTLAKMRLATSEVYKNDKGERITETQWHDVVAWGKQAEIAGQYLKKGSEVMIEGKLMYHEYTGKDGVKRMQTEIQVSSLMMMDKKTAA